MEKLAIVMPVYNEEEAIGAVLDKWVTAMDKLGIEYTINPYNDGSKDNSYQVIQAKAEQYPGKVIAHTKPNGGHGPTILHGYREAAAAGYDWVFQIDSDDEMGPEGFPELWNNRENYDFLVGIRDGRKQALPRKIISAVSRLSVRLFYGKSIWDVNTPYRLMRVSAFKDVWDVIPSDTFAPNVIISGMAARKKLRCFETRVPQHDRQTGEVSIKKWKLFKAAAKSFCQTIWFSLSISPAFFVLTLCVLSLMTVVSLGRGVVCRRICDFHYFSAKYLLQGINPYELFFNSIAQTGKICFAEPCYPPSCIITLFPYTFFSVETAHLLWALSNIVFAVIVFFVSYKLFFPNKGITISSENSLLLWKNYWWIVACLLFLSCNPLRVCICVGQQSMWSLLFFVIALYLYKQEKTIACGCVLFFAVFKYTSVFPLLFVFLSQKKGIYSLLIAAFLHIVVTAILSYYTNTSLTTMTLQSLIVGSRLCGQGQFDLASCFWGFGTPDYCVRRIALVGYIVCFVLLLFVSFSKRYHKLLKLSIFAVISNIMFYHRIYDCVFLIFLLMLFFYQRDNGATMRWLDYFLIVFFLDTFYLRSLWALFIPEQYRVVFYFICHIIILFGFLLDYQIASPANQIQINKTNV